MNGEQQAKITFESLFGWCWVCGATLTKDEDTVCAHGAHRPPSENTRNRGMHKNNSLGVKGVYADGKRYRAQITFDKQKINLGSFGTATEASKAYQDAARRLFGQFCAS